MWYFIASTDCTWFNSHKHMPLSATDKNAPSYTQSHNTDKKNFTQQTIFSVNATYIYTHILKIAVTNTSYIRMMSQRRILSSIMCSLIEIYWCSKGTYGIHLPLFYPQDAVSKYLQNFGKLLTNQHYIIHNSTLYSHHHKKVKFQISVEKGRLNPSNVSNHSFKNTLSKTLKIKIHKTMIFPTVLIWCETWYLPLGENRRLGNV